MVLEITWRLSMCAWDSGTNDVVHAMVLVVVVRTAVTNKNRG